MGIDYLIFGNVDSRDYDILVFFKDVDHTPKRVYQRIAIPGRNGEFFLDENRFEDVKVSYDCVALNDTDRKNFVNALSVQIGHARLTDTFNVEEYCSAVFDGDIDPNVRPNRDSSTFTITFTRKPQRYLKSGENATMIVKKESGAVVTFEGDEKTSIKGLTVDIKSVQSGSGTPSPTNVRPISGWDRVIVNRTGNANIWDEEWEVGYFDSSGNWHSTTSTTSINSKNKLVVLPNTEYYCKSSDDIYVYYYDANRSFIKSELVTCNSVFTTDSDAHYLNFNTQDTYGKTYKNDISINYPSTDHEYHAYNGDAYTISLQGTWYGGTLDVFNGLRTVTHSIKRFNGTGDTYSFISEGRVNIDFSFPYKKEDGYDSGISNLYRSIAQVSSDSAFNSKATSYASCYALSSGTTTIRIKDSRFTDLDTAKQLLAETPLEVVLEANTPSVTQITPQQVSTLVGTNNIWANSGDVSVEVLPESSELINPTLFESSPLLELVGYGDVQFNNYDVDVHNVVELIAGGEVESEKDYGSATTNRSANLYAIPTDFNVGDMLMFGRVKVVATYELEPLSGRTIVSVEPLTSGMVFSAHPSTDDKWIVTLQYTLDGGTIESGNTGSTIVNEKRLKIREYYNSGTSGDSESRFYYATSWFENVFKQNISFHIWDSLFLKLSAATFYYEPIYAESTVPLFDSPIYIDCEYGEAYRIKDGKATSLNAYIDLGFDLPKLASGSNEVTYDNTIAELKMTPRWWKV